MLGLTDKRWTKLTGAAEAPHQGRAGYRRLVVAFVFLNTFHFYFSFTSYGGWFFSIGRVASIPTRASKI